MIPIKKFRTIMSITSLVFLAISASMIFKGGTTITGAVVGTSNQSSIGGLIFFLLALVLGVTVFAINE